MPILATATLISIGMVSCSTGNNQNNTNTPVATAENTMLDGSKWTIVLLNDSQLIAGSTITLFFENGTARGSAGINLYGGKYVVEPPDKLNFSNGVSTTLGGPADIIRQEQTYLGNINESAFYRFNNNRLEIYNTANRRLLVFARLSE